MYLSHVNLKITHFTVGYSQDPERPITVGFMYEGHGKDNAREGFQADVTRAEAVRMAEMILRSAGIAPRGAGSGMSERYSGRRT